METKTSTMEAVRDRFDSETQGNDASLKANHVCLQDMPIDIIEHIISFLSAQSLLGLMVSRAFRQICEQNLSRNIRILSSGRTCHLCKAFVLRPDLALLVRDLEICIRSGSTAQTLPTFSREGGAIVFTFIEALALAKNVRSFHAIDEVWAADRDTGMLRDLICGMKLRRLRISNSPLFINQNPNSDAGYMSYLRTILQAQPLLEVLELPYSSAGSGWMEHPDRQPTSDTSPLPENTTYPSITSSDIPNLRSLVATTSVAASFLPIVPKLESLAISYWDIQLPYALLHAERLGHLIRSLKLTLPWRKFMDWGGIGDVLCCFPNVETLVAETSWSKIYEDGGSGENFLGQVSQKIHFLPLLRKLEVYYRPNYETAVPIDLEITPEQLMELKQRCPLLEYVIDPLGRMWAYTTTTNYECSGFKPLGRLAQEPNKSLRDILYSNPTS